jgi:hypothetical protein
VAARAPPQWREEEGSVTALEVLRDALARIVAARDDPSIAEHILRDLEVDLVRFIAELEAS